jgi:SAM-dependent methyltransferase
MILHCRACQSDDIKQIFSLGFTPLANALLTKDQINRTEEKYPLDLVFCQSCSLVQIVETVPPEKLFSEYFYVSSVSKTTVENARALAQNLIEKLSLDGNSHVLEIGSNDGYLLKNYIENGINVIGVEPAKSLSDVANSKGIRTINGFFNKVNAMKLSGDIWQPSSKEATWRYKADIIHANNVLAHVADIHGVLEGIKYLLRPDGVAVVETHYVRDLIEGNQFDCVYHEHLFFYSATSIKRLFEIHDLELVDIERIPMHGGSLRGYFQLMDGPKSMKNKRVGDLLKEESDLEMDNPYFYQRLGVKVLTLKSALIGMLKKLKADGKRIAIFGASAKSTTLLNYFCMDGVFEYVVDDTPNKQGHFTPGTHLPIYPTSKLLEDMPEYTLMLTWNFKDEILERQKAYREKGGKFIVPIPKLEIV